MKKNSPVNIRFMVFVMAFRARKLFGTFEKRAPGPEVLSSGDVFFSSSFCFRFSQVGNVSIFILSFTGGNINCSHK